MTLLRAVIDTLATYRLTRLAITDGIADRPREAVLAWTIERRHPKLTELLECPWCLGFWVAIAVLAARALFPRLWDHAAAALAVSAIVGLIWTWDEEHRGGEA